MAEQLIKVTGVSKNYRKGRETVRVLDGISLSIDKGDFVGLMGPSGSGKTTLLNLLGGLDKPTAGEVEVDGKTISALSPGALSKWRSGNIGFIFQFYNLLPVLTAARNVALAAVAHLAAGVAAQAACEHGPATGGSGRARVALPARTVRGSGTARGHRPRHRVRSAHPAMR